VRSICALAHCAAAAHPAIATATAGWVAGCADQLVASRLDRVRTRILNAVTIGLIRRLLRNLPSFGSRPMLLFCRADVL
jgi:hypothetical protein